MAEREIQEPAQELIDAGRRLVEAMDALGLDAQCVAWVYVPSIEDWRFVVVTPLVESEGPAWVRKRLWRALGNMPVREDFLAIDIDLASPREPWFIALSSVFHVGDGAFLHVADMTVSYPDATIAVPEFTAYVYRMTREPPSKRHIKETRNTFDMKSRLVPVA